MTNIRETALKVIEKEIDDFNKEIENLHYSYKLGFITYEKYLIELNYAQGRIDSLYFSKGILKTNFERVEQ